MAVPSRFYRRFVDLIHERGWDARALGRRGFEDDGIRAGRGSDWSYADEARELGHAIEAARTENPQRPVVVIGHSLGAQISVAYEMSAAATGRRGADGLVLIGASVPHHRPYPYRGLPIYLLGAAVPLVTRCAGYLPRPMFGAPGATTLMNQWARWVRTGRPPFIVDGPLNLPTLAVQLENDFYAVPAALRQFLDQFIATDQQTWYDYTSAQTPEGGTTDHLRWIRHPEVVLDRIETWWADQERRRGEALKPR